MRDTLAAWPARALAATLDHADPGGLNDGAPLPPLWIWLYFLQTAPQRSLGPDGHPERGGFLPPVTLPRRMWGGSRMTFHAPLRIGDDVERVSTILSVTEKDGRNGPLAFVTVRHAISVRDALALEDEQDIAFMTTPERFAPPPPTPLPECTHRERVAIDPVFLFRISALTFNSHRIHYDRAYATEVEHYPGLVVHGPAQALLLYGAATRWAPGRTPARFTFRAVAPLFDFDDASVNGRAREDGGLDLFTANAAGAVAMQARLDWKS
jgi:3-methylfumaryl-CoA hydratase